MYQHVRPGSEQSTLRDTAFGLGLDGVHIEGNLMYKKCNGTREKM